MLKILFSSETRVKILSLLITNPRNRYYLREIIKVINAPLRAVQRELSKLAATGLLIRETEGNRVYYQINSGHYLFTDLKNLILKTVGFGDLLKSPLLHEKEIDLAFIYGSYAANKETTISDIDLFIVGTITSKKLQSLLRKVILLYGRIVNPVIYSPAEFRRKRHGHFISSIWEKPKIWLKGYENAF